VQWRANPSRHVAGPTKLFVDVDVTSAVPDHFRGDIELNVVPPAGCLTVQISTRSISTGRRASGQPLQPETAFKHRSRDEAQIRYDATTIPSPKYSGSKTRSTRPTNSTARPCDRGERSKSLITWHDIDS